MTETERQSAGRWLEVMDLGPAPYAETLALQHDLVSRRARAEIEDRLVLVEHDPIVTVGRGADASAAADVPFPVVEVERGGEATFHGPGQLVGYPILALREDERDLHRYLRDLEEVLIRAVARFGIAGRRDPPHTGVWVDSHKIASIGVAVRRWVTYHGFALNVSNDLSAFRSFRPCGLAPDVMTSMSVVLGAPVAVADVAAGVVSCFSEVFGRETRPARGE